MPQLLVEFRTLSGPGGVAAILSLAGRQPRRTDGRATGQSGRSLPPLSLPHHHELRQHLSQGSQPRGSDRRNQADDGQAEGLMFPKRLTEGYRTFLNGRFASERARYQELAGSGQSPTIMVIGCVDSRVSPEVIFDAAPGELLVARNVANLVPRYEPPSEEDPSHQHGTSAALEFAVRALKVAHIVVLGHAFCGGIKAFAVDSAPLSSSDFIGRWMSQIAPAAEAIGPQGG